MLLSRSSMQYYAIGYLRPAAWTCTCQLSRPQTASFDRSERRESPLFFLVWAYVRSASQKNKLLFWCGVCAPASPFCGHKTNPSSRTTEYRQQVWISSSVQISSSALLYNQLSTTTNLVPSHPVELIPASHPPNIIHNEDSLHSTFPQRATELQSAAAPDDKFQWRLRHRHRHGRCQYDSRRAAPSQSARDGGWNFICQWYVNGSSIGQNATSLFHVFFSHTHPTSITAHTSHTANKYSDAVISIPEATKPGDMLVIYIGGSHAGNLIPSSPIPRAGWEEIIDIGPSDLNLKAFYKPYESYGDDDTYKVTDGKSTFVSIVAIRGLNKRRPVVDSGADKDVVSGREGGARAPNVQTEDDGVVLAR